MFVKYYALGTDAVLLYICLQFLVMSQFPIFLGQTSTKQRIKCLAKDYLRSKFDFWIAHEIMNTSGLLQSK